MSTVVFLGPGYPGEMALFTRGLAEVGARVIGVGDQPVEALPPMARDALWKYVQIDSWADEDAVVHSVLSSLRGLEVDLIETLWEPTVVLAARLRACITVDVRQELMAVRVPILNVFAANDSVLPSTGEREISLLRPDARVTIIPGGHAILECTPKEAAHAITDFVTSLPVV